MKKKSRNFSSDVIKFVVILILIYILLTKPHPTQIDATSISSVLNAEKFNSSAVEHYVFESTNQERQKSGLTNLTRVSDLDMLALYHSTNMVNYHFFNHTDNEGLDPTGRAKKLGIRYIVIRDIYLYQGIGENIAMTPRAIRVVNCTATLKNSALANCTMDGFINSPKHYENLVGDYQEIGVGAVLDTNTSYAYITQDFR